MGRASFGPRKVEFLAPSSASTCKVTIRLKECAKVVSVLLWILSFTSDQLHAYLISNTAEDTSGSWLRCKLNVNRLQYECTQRHSYTNKGSVKECVVTIAVRWIARGLNWLDYTYLNINTFVTLSS